MITVTVEVDTPKEAAYVAEAVQFRSKVRKCTEQVCFNAMDMLRRNNGTFTHDGERRFELLKEEFSACFKPLEKILGEG